MTPAEIIARAADILDQPGAWADGPSVTSSGVKVHPRDRKAARWDIGGAMMKALPRRGAKYGDALLLLERQVGAAHYSIWESAPGRTQAEVVAALRGAIQ